MLGSILGPVTIAVESWFERRFRIGANRGRDEDAITPNDRARMRETRNLRFPENIFAGLAVPLIWQVLSLCHARSAWTTKRGPASFHRCRFQTRGRPFTGGPRDISHRVRCRFFR